MKDRMLAGGLYLASDPELVADRARARALLELYNGTRAVEHEDRARLLRELLGEVGEDVVIMPTFRCDYGYNISLGAGTFVNYDCVLLDVVPIRIGAACSSRHGCSFSRRRIPSIPIRGGGVGKPAVRSRLATTSGLAAASSFARE